MPQNKIDENRFDDFLDDNPGLIVSSKTEGGGLITLSIYSDARGDVKAIRVDAIKNKREDKNSKRKTDYYLVTD